MKADPGQIEPYLMDMQMEKRLVVKRKAADISDSEQEDGTVSGRDDELHVYAAVYYYMELNVARMLHDLNIKGHESVGNIQERLWRIQEEEKMELDPLQIQAVAEAVNSGLLIITGGPGTGKTTTINTIIR